MKLPEPRKGEGRKVMLMSKVIQRGFFGFVVTCLILGNGVVLAKGRQNGSSQDTAHGWKGGGAPPGWSQGKKTGWHGESMPPGLAKKQGGDEEKRIKKEEKKKKGKQEQPKKKEETS